MRTWSWLCYHNPQINDFTLWDHHLWSSSWSNFWGFPSGRHFPNTFSKKFYDYVFQIRFSKTFLKTILNTFLKTFFEDAFRICYPKHFWNHFWRRWWSHKVKSFIWGLWYQSHDQVLIFKHYSWKKYCLQRGLLCNISQLPIRK